MERTLKHSRQREYLIEIMQNTKCHPNANWIFMEMKKRFCNISQATVYRNLKLLAVTGKIKKISVGDGVEHYDITTINHYHFVCENCSKIEDIDIQTIDIIDDEVREKLCVDVNRHELVFYGTCADCMSKLEGTNIQ